MRIILACLLLLVVAADALAKSREEVAANCLSLSQVRKVYPGSYPHYRSVGGRQCWYVEGKALPRVARAVPEPVRPKPASPSLPSPEPVLEALCGGPCLVRQPGDISVYEALCGGPCPMYDTFETRWSMLGARDR